MKFTHYISWRGSSSAKVISTVLDRIHGISPVLRHAPICNWGIGQPAHALAVGYNYQPPARKIYGLHSQEPTHQHFMAQSNPYFVVLPKLAGEPLVAVWSRHMLFHQTRGTGQDLVEFCLPRSRHWARTNVFEVPYLRGCCKAPRVLYDPPMITRALCIVTP